MSMIKSPDEVPEGAQEYDINRPDNKAGEGYKGKGSSAAIIPAVEEAASKLHEAGVFNKDLPLEERITEYLSYEAIGAPPAIIREAMDISNKDFKVLKNLVVDYQINALQEQGVIGTVAQIYHRLDFASRKALEFIATLDTADKTVLSALRTLTDIETRKMDLMVRSGAVNVERRISIRQDLENSRQDYKVITGDEALQLLAVLDEDSDEDSVYSEYDTSYIDGN